MEQTGNIQQEFNSLPVRQVGAGRPMAWLAAGWRDLVRAPLPSLSFGVVFAAVGYLLIGLAFGAIGLSEDSTGEFCRSLFRVVFIASRSD